MNCDDFLPALETGGIIGRIQAAAHARRCQQCAAVRANLENAKRQWADSSVVTPRHREMWQRVAIAEPRATRFSRPRALKWALAAGVAGVLITALTLTRWSDHPAETETAHRQTTTTAPTDVPKFSPALQPHDLEAIESVEDGLAQLVVELKDLQEQADLVDARHDVDRLLSTYRPLGSSEPAPRDAH